MFRALVVAIGLISMSAPGLAVSEDDLQRSQREDSVSAPEILGNQEVPEFGWHLFKVGAADGGFAVEGDCSCPPFLCVCGATCALVGSPPFSCEFVASSPDDSCFYRSCSYNFPNC